MLCMNLGVGKEYAKETVVWYRDQLKDGKQIREEKIVDYKMWKRERN